ncbi:Uncharacterized protein SCF082_LOCUS21814 [Durusdinium trenchii]|uniref:Uncharacterized protein n=1 Tax=Durusdinium trenchii TaxID=1381693 RepID=A0ABP0LBX3_9DINO
MGLAMMAKCLLRKASVADVLAAVIAHPGQLLEPTSLFPLQSTMKIKMLSVTAVVASQAFARYASASEHAKACRARSAGLSWMWREAIPDWLLAAWLGLSAVSWMGRVTYSAVKTALACTDEVPLAVLMALTHDCILSLDGGAEHLVSSDAWAASKLKLGSTFFSKIGNHGTRQDLDLSFCHEIPTDAWEVLETANWSNLKKASFEQCFDDNTKGAEGAKHLLKALAQSAALEELDLTDCSQIPSDAWGVLQTHPGLWPCLRKSFGIPEQVTFGPSFARGLTDFQILPRIFRSVRIPRAFSGHDRTVPFEASSLLAALAQSAALEDLNLSDCNQIPSDAWEALQTANWSNLKKASFEQCFDDNTKGAEGAKHLLKALAQSAALEDLELSFCDQIPTDAWEILQTANWSNLRKASFEQCFDDNTKGAEGAKHLLKALAQSAALEELDLTDCSQIPSDAWGALQTRPEVLWPCLRKSFGVPEQVALERGIE